MSYRYNCFGLKINSEIEFPELISDNDDSEYDVEIKLGKNPEHLEQPTQIAVGYEIGVKQLLLRLEGVAFFLVTNGNSIIVDKRCEDCDNDVRLFILGTCLGTILLQKNILPLHASAFEYKGEAILICGNSGVGKSSTANSFRIEGHKMLTDDICAISFDHDKPCAISGYPQSKMWEDSLNALNVNLEGLETIRKEISKRKLPIRNSFYTGTLPIKRMYLLTKYNGKTIEVNEVTQGNKINCVLKMTFRKYLIKDMKIQVGHFINTTKFAEQVEIRRIRRPNDCKIEDLKIFIENDITSN